MKRYGSIAGSSAGSNTTPGVLFVLFVFFVLFVLGLPARLEVEAAELPDATPPPASPAGNVETSSKPEPASAPSAANSPSASSTNVPSLRASAGIAELEKMVAAGVSKDVLKAYIENARVVRSLTPEEMISLKEHGVPDEIVVALLKRAGETRARAREEASAALSLVPAAGAGSGDPESYDFWWSHYAYPRVLSSTYRTLAPYPIEYYGPHAPFAGQAWRARHWGAGVGHFGGPGWRAPASAPGTLSVGR